MIDHNVFLFLPQSKVWTVCSRLGWPPWEIKCDNYLSLLWLLPVTSFKTVQLLKHLGRDPPRGGRKAFLKTPSEPNAASALCIWNGIWGSFMHLKEQILIRESFSRFPDSFKKRLGWWSWWPIEVIPGWHNLRPFKVLALLSNWEDARSDIFLAVGITGHMTRVVFQFPNKLLVNDGIPADNDISVLLVWGRRRVFLIVGTNTRLHLWLS